MVGVGNASEILKATSLNGSKDLLPPESCSVGDLNSCWRENPIPPLFTRPFIYAVIDTVHVHVRIQCMHIYLHVYCASQWVPDGRRLITGANSGEFTLWNGVTFNFESILQVHHYAGLLCAVVET